MSSWLKVRADMPRDASVVHLPSDAARWAWIATLCEAKTQSTPGEFASVRHWAFCVGRTVQRWLPALLHEGLVTMVDDRVVVTNWKQHQVDPTGAERSQRYRDKPVTDTVTSPSRHSDVTPSRARIETEIEKETLPPSPPSQDEPYVVAYHAATGRAPTALQRAKLYELHDRHSLAWLVENLTGPDPLGHCFEVDSEWQRARRKDVAAEEAAWKRKKRLEQVRAAKSEVAREFFNPESAA